jgi:hypothetical protein
MANDRSANSDVPDWVGVATPPLESRLASRRAVVTAHCQPGVSAIAPGSVQPPSWSRMLTARRSRVFAEGAADLDRDDWRVWS